MRHLALAAVSLAFVASGCQSATTELTDEQKAAIEKEVMQLQTDWWDAWETFDYPRWRSFLADDARWGRSPPAVFWEMHELGPAARRWMSEIIETTSEIEDSFVRVLDPGAAVIGLTYLATNVDRQGVSGRERIALTAVWARVDGTWKVVHGHHSAHLTSPDPF